MVDLKTMQRLDIARGNLAGAAAMIERGDHEMARAEIADIVAELRACGVSDEGVQSLLRKFGAVLPPPEPER